MPHQFLRPEWARSLEDMVDNLSDNYERACGDKPELVIGNPFTLFQPTSETKFVGNVLGIPVYTNGGCPEGYVVAGRRQDLEQLI